ncbi:unnamed protein product [Alternaria alternata]
MGLLNLPPELFAKVIRLCVDKDNVREVSKQRLTCKTIKHYLDHELFSKMPVRAFTRAGSKSARTLLKNKLAHHLVHRVVNIDKLRGAHSFLPIFIKDCLELLRFMKVLKQGDDEYVYALMLANQLAVVCSIAYTLATSNPSSPFRQRLLSRFDFASGNQAVEQMAMAAVVGCLEVVQSLKQIYGTELLWDRSYPFGHPLAAVAGGNHIEVVGAIVADLEYNYRPDLSPAYRAAFISAIDVLLARQHCDMSLFLIDLYHHHFPGAFKHSLRRWLVKAAVYPDDRIYLRLTSLAEDGDVRKHMVPFEMACRYGYIPYILRFFDYNILQLNEYFYIYEGLVLVRVDTPLSLAIGVGNWHPVNILRSMGAF